MVSRTLRAISSFPPPTNSFEGRLRRESIQLKGWIPACAGMTRVIMRPIDNRTIVLYDALVFFLP